jgi:hypothetical protein
MVALEKACRNRSNVRLLTPDDATLPKNSAQNREPFQWTVNIGSRQKCGVIPDRVFGLEFTDKSRRKNRSWFSLEADRATMPVMRGNLHQSSFYRKLLAYEATWKQNIHRFRFGWNRFRVLTVTTNPARLATMQEAARSLKHGHGLFLFADGATLSEQKDLFAFRWQTYREGQTAGLLD